MCLYLPQDFAEANSAAGFRAQSTMLKINAMILDRIVFFSEIHKYFRA